MHEETRHRDFLGVEQADVCSCKLEKVRRPSKFTWSKKCVQKIKPETVIFYLLGKWHSQKKKKNGNAVDCRCTFPSIHLVTALALHINSLSSSLFSSSSSPSLSVSLFIDLACGGFKKERTLCVQLSVGSPNLAIHNACHVSLFPSALFEPAKTTTVSDRPSSPDFRSWSMKNESNRTVPR